MISAASPRSDLDSEGAGGLMTGMDESGFVETKWAIEHDPSAALTLRSAILISLLRRAQVDFLMVPS